MNHRTAVSALCLVILHCGLVHAADQRPNILFMFADDQPQNCLGISGNADIQTPHLDALAQKGTFFNNAFVTTAICCSSRASILTGQHMYRHGITEFRTPLSAEAFAQSYPALLRKAGYRTGYMGKFAIGNPTMHERELCLPARQFDTWYGFPQSINFKQVIDGQTRHLTQVMTDKAIEFLRSDSEQPFCLTIAFKEPHGPFNYFDPAFPNIYEEKELATSPTLSRDHFERQPDFIRTSLNGTSSRERLDPANERRQSELRTFYRTITRADAAVGAILAELKKLGLDDNTVVIYSSDHGSLLGDHGLSGKWLMYENSIRVPLIIYDPRVEANVGHQRRDEIALNIDLAKTMLSLAGIEPPAAMQGEDLMPIVRGKSPSWRRHFYYEHVYNTNPPRAPIPVTEGIRTEDWKYIRYPKVSPVYEQLFDLRADPRETENLAGREQHAERLQQLRKLCDSEVAKR